MENIHKFFASANTGDGFICYFDQINSGGFNYVIKGGSGTGKSSMMKRVGEHFAKRGYKVEYFYCSSDASSLDGVKIPQKGVAMLDGTAPHITEVDLPSVSGKIVNVGEFASRELIKNKSELLSIKAEKSKYFIDAYKYLSAAKEVYEIVEGSYFCTRKKLDENIKRAKSRISREEKNKNAVFAERKLFGSVFSSSGASSFYSENGYEMISLSGNLSEQSVSLNKIVELAKEKGVAVTLFFSPVKRDCLEAVLFDKFNALFLKTMDKKVSQSEEFKLYSVLVERALSRLNSAMYAHKKLEEYYISAMDFGKVEILTSQIIAEIELMDDTAE